MKKTDIQDYTIIVNKLIEKDENIKCSTCNKGSLAEIEDPDGSEPILVVQCLAQGLASNLPLNSVFYGQCLLTQAWKGYKRSRYYHR